MNLGTHWADPLVQYRPNTPTVDLAYVTAPAGGVFSPAAAMKRIEVYAATHPEATVVLRVDWGRAAHSFPLAPDLAEWRDGFEQFGALDHLGSRLVMQVGNEPQLEGAESVQQVVEAWWTAAEEIRHSLPQARIGSVPVATFNPDRLGAAEGVSLEGSPWSDLDYELRGRLFDRPDLHPDVDLLHVYGDGANAVTTDINSLDSHDWRFGINVAETWEENREELGVWTTPVIITEFNTAARGVSPPHRPLDNYQAGWLRDSMLYLQGALPQATDICWFVGSASGPRVAWSPFAVDCRADLQADFTAAL